MDNKPLLVQKEFSLYCTVIWLFQHHWVRHLAISCTCMHGRPCTSSPLLPRPHDTCCRSGGCSHSRLHPSSRTFPAASGSGHRCARRTAGRSSLHLSFVAPGARVSYSWGQDEGNQRHPQNIQYLLSAWSLKQVNLWSYHPFLIIWSPAHQININAWLLSVILICCWSTAHLLFSLRNCYISHTYLWK